MYIFLPVQWIDQDSYKKLTLCFFQMASPQKKLLQELRRKREEKEFYNPLNNLPKGEKFPITYFTTAKSQFNNNSHFSLVVHYVMRSTKCFTYLTGQFKSPLEEDIKKMEETFNAGIKSKKKKKKHLSGLPITAWQTKHTNLTFWKKMTVRIFFLCLF